MVQEGLREIYSLFIEKVNSTFNQIIDKLVNNQKFKNANFYFFKDFPFFYFCLKFYSLNIFAVSEFENKDMEEMKSQNFCFFNNYNLLNSKNSSETPIINITKLKNLYLDKLRGICEENLSRGFNLIKLQEKNLDGIFSNCILLRETIANENITLYLINYIKQMSWSYIDLLEEFNLNNEEIILDSDLLLFEVSNLFSEKLKEKFFDKIKISLIELFNQIKNNNILVNDNEIIDKHKNSENKPSSLNLLIFKYFYYLNILNKMNDILFNFQSSNVKYLISDNLKSYTEFLLNEYTQTIFNEFLQRLMKDLKLILINKDFNSL